MVVGPGGNTLFSTSANFGYGTRSFAVPALKHKGTYTIRLAATDLAGNFARISGRSRCPDASGRGLSTISVTGPSLTSSTAIIAPNTPRAAPEPLAEALVQRLGAARAPRPRRSSAGCRVARRRTA